MFYSNIYILVAQRKKRKDVYIAQATSLYTIYCPFGLAPYLLLTEKNMNNIKYADGHRVH